MRNWLNPSRTVIVWPYVPYVISTDIKASKFVDDLYIDWPVAEQLYASKADVVGLPYQD